MKHIPYGKQYIDQNDIDAVTDVLKSDWLTQGPMVKEFEEMVAAYHRCKYAVSFSNGTAALHGAYYVSTKFPFGKNGRRLQDLSKFISGKIPSQQEYETFKSQYWEFITTPITFVASANGGVYCGGTPRMVDIDQETYCIDIGKIEARITEDTRVITPVSYAGYPVDIKAIKNLPMVRENNICIIHDACHAIGALRDGLGIADFSDMTILSFHPVKHITTGEGGMVLTNNKEYYEKLILFRNHGITKELDIFSNVSEGDWYYEMQELGYNYRITDIQCALGISQMKKIGQFLRRRNQIAKIYEEKLKDIDWVKTPPGFDKKWLEEETDSIDSIRNLHAYHLFPIRLEHGTDRKEFFEYMKKNNIGVQVHYIPIFNLPYHSINMSNSKDFPIASEFYQVEISLPMYYSLSDADIEHIVDLIKCFA